MTVKQAEMHSLPIRTTDGIRKDSEGRDVKGMIRNKERPQLKKM